MASTKLPIHIDRRGMNSFLLFPTPARNPALVGFPQGDTEGLPPLVARHRESMSFSTPEGSRTSLRESVGGAGSFILLAKVPAGQLCALTWITFYIMYPCSYTYIGEWYAISYFRI